MAEPKSKEYLQDILVQLKTMRDPNWVRPEGTSDKFLQPVLVGADRNVLTQLSDEHGNRYALFYNPKEPSGFSVLNEPEAYKMINGELRDRADAIQEDNRFTDFSKNPDVHRDLQSQYNSLTEAHPVYHGYLSANMNKDLSTVVAGADIKDVVPSVNLMPKPGKPYDGPRPPSDYDRPAIQPGRQRETPEPQPEPKTVPPPTVVEASEPPLQRRWGGDTPVPVAVVPPTTVAAAPAPESAAARDPYSWALETGTLLSQGKIDDEDFRKIISDPTMAPYAAVLNNVHAQIEDLKATGDAWTVKQGQEFYAAVGAVYGKELSKETPGIQPEPVEIKSGGNSAELDSLPQNIRDSYIALKPYFEGKLMDGTGQMYASSLALALDMYQQNDCTEAQVEKVEKDVRTALDKLLGVSTIACGQYPADVPMRLQEIIDRQNQQNTPALQLQQQM